MHDQDELLIEAEVVRRVEARLQGLDTAKTNGTVSTTSVVAADVSGSARTDSIPKLNGTADTSNVMLAMPYLVLLPTNLTAWCRVLSSHRLVAQKWRCFDTSRNQRMAEVRIVVEEMKRRTHVCSVALGSSLFAFAGSSLDSMAATQPMRSTVDPLKLPFANRPDVSDDRGALEQIQQGELAFPFCPLPFF